MSDEARLLALRDRASTDVAAQDASLGAITAARADANSDDEHDPEGATIGFERAQHEALRAAATRRLAEVDAALDRLRAGVYGVCAVCGGPIAPGRLEARPTAERCVVHAAEG